MGKALILTCALFALVACATTKPPLSDPRSIWCEQNSPRRDATDDTPRWELDEINAQNAKGKLWCGWAQ